uniref:Pentapeptide repeat-containing protein n=1 Tax=Candidatus Kentrum sp. FM TaxID=2126340 RepID=A0A450RZ84_9GAMM|nr:MAG: Pentapeptide repeat-containing protein [Candidatus Kentron sp. FM]VFJ44998.1 MAG: Pentapeptide repeat-containing protein [Candidatus Kentron sp. FM]VFK06626.1 MAG: Pentapeptide repeat-containing protein [Candidatus Kentron sp. FM]
MVTFWLIIKETFLGLYLLIKVILRFCWNYSGFRHIWEMARFRDINASDYKKPPTLVLWIIGIYIALYGIASTRYEATLDRVENRMATLASQLSTSNAQAFESLIAQIPRIQQMKTPLEPRLPWSSQGCRVKSSLLTDDENPDILRWTRETIETWKGKLAEMKLQGIDLSKARLEEADLSEARLQRANLSGARLQRANLFRARLVGANLSKAMFQKANLFGARLELANLSGAGLDKANLSEAKLEEADLSGAWLEGTNLFKAELGGIKNWRDIASIKGTNILEVKFAPEGFRAWALERGAVEMESEEWKAFWER